MVPGAKPSVKPAPAMTADQRQALRAQQQAAYIERRQAALRRPDTNVFADLISQGVREAFAGPSPFDIAERKAVEARMKTRGAEIAELEKGPKTVAFSGLQEFSRSIQTSLYDTGEEGRDKEKIKLLRAAQAADEKQLSALDKIAKNTEDSGGGGMAD